MNEKVKELLLTFVVVFIAAYLAVTVALTLNKSKDTSMIMPPPPMNMNNVKPIPPSGEIPQTNYDKNN